MNEKDVQNAIVDALIWDGWLILGVNQQDSGINNVIAVKGRITVAVSDGDDVQFLKTPVQDTVLLAIEVKAPGKKRQCPSCAGGSITWTINCHICGNDGYIRDKKEPIDKQQEFLDAVIARGGIAIVADCLEDVEPYLERIEEQ